MFGKGFHTGHPNMVNDYFVGHVGYTFLPQCWCYRNTDMIRIRWRQSPGNCVCESNIVAPLGLSEVSTLYRLACYRTSKPGSSNKPTFH